MAWELLWSDDHLDELEKSYGPQVRERAEKKLSDKEDQIGHMQRPEQVVKRFHNHFGLGELEIVEVAFSSQDYRIICAVDRSDERIIYLTGVKKGSEQRQALDLLRDTSEQIKEDLGI